MRVTIEFDLDDEILSDSKANSYKVLKFSDFHVCPENKKFGTVSMRALVEYAKLYNYDFIIGFADLAVIEFYRKCGFVVSDKPYKWKDEDRLLFADKEVPKDLIIGDTW